MTYIPIRSGFTGPSAKIGGSTEYHQDLKLLQSLPVTERVKMLDAIAKQNQSIGREIEFSNPAVSGRRWNLNAELAEKVDLLERAAAAHGHSKHSGWQSFDYYTPLKNKNRFEKGAVEDASIYLPAVASGKVRRGSGGGYGYFSESLDPSGRVIARVGHGNIDRPEAGDVNVLGAPPQAPVLPVAPATTAQQPTQTTEDLLKRMLLQEALAPSKSQDFLTSFLMQNPYLAGGQEQSA